MECGRSRETAKRSELAGWAEYGYCASHSRFFWGLRLHLLCTLSGLPVAFALAGAKADEREVLLGMLDADPNLMTAHRRQKLMADKNYYGKAFEAALADAELQLLRPARKGEKPRPGQRYFKPFRQIIESINNTFKTQLDLEHHGGRTIAGVTSRVLQRVLALTAAIWHNDQPASPCAIADRLRPLTPWNYSSSSGGSRWCAHRHARDALGGRRGLRLGRACVHQAARQQPELFIGEPRRWARRRSFPGVFGAHRLGRRRKPSARCVRHRNLR